MFSFFEQSCLDFLIYHHTSYKGKPYLAHTLHELKITTKSHLPPLTTFHLSFHSCTKAYLSIASFEAASFERVKDKIKVMQVLVFRDEQTGDVCSHGGNRRCDQTAQLQVD